MAAAPAALTPAASVRIPGMCPTHAAPLSCTLVCVCVCVCVCTRAFYDCWAAERCAPAGGIRGSVQAFYAAWALLLPLCSVVILSQPCCPNPPYSALSALACAALGRYGHKAATSAEARMQGKGRRQTRTVSEVCPLPHRHRTCQQATGHPQRMRRASCARCCVGPTPLCQSSRG